MISKQAKITRQPTAATSYRDRLKSRFKQQVQDIVQKYSLSELVIVLDAKSAFLLSNVFSITELVAMRIIYLERLEVKRKKLDKHALYFISPIKANIDLLISDFQEESPQGSIPQYKKIHILFTTFVEKGLLKELALHKPVLKRIARNSLKEFYFSCRILGLNLVDFNVPYLSLAFSKDSEQEVSKRQTICKKIIEFVANFDQVNTVRIFFKKSPNQICERVAASLEHTVKRYLGILLENRSPNLIKSAQDITILLMDRSVDTVTPFVHYFTFEALLFDFFTISMVAKSDLVDKGAYSYEQIQNPVFDEFRYRHLSEALSKLPEALEDERGRLEGLKSTEGDSFNIKQLTDRVGWIKSNIEKLEAIWKQFQDKQMEEVADLEQSLATGITGLAENTSSIKLISQVEKLVRESDLTRDEKLRLAIICFSCVKLSKQDYQLLLQLFSNEERKVLKNLIALGVSYDGSLSKSTKTITKDQQKIAEQRMKATGMPLNRYTSIAELVVPLFCRILQDPLQAQSIDRDIFGELICSVFKSGTEERKFSPDNFGLCMVGGLSWAEISAIRNCKELQNSVLMADAIMTASEFIQEIGKINILKN